MGHIGTVAAADPMHQFMLPDLGEGLEEAEIVTWYVNEGDHVATDQPLVSVETDKAVVEIPSPSNGRIARLLSAKGDIVKVGATLVEFAEVAEQDTGTIVGELGSDEHPPAGIASTRPAGQVFPAVRTLARKLDVDLRLVEGTGPGGSITRADVERAAKRMSQTGSAETHARFAPRYGPTHDSGPCRNCPHHSDG